jgi:hypothetical protein
MVCSADPPIPVFGYRHGFHQRRSTQRTATIQTAPTEPKTGILWTITVLDQTLPPHAHYLVLETFQAVGPPQTRTMAEEMSEILRERAWPTQQTYATTQTEKVFANLHSANAKSRRFFIRATLMIPTHFRSCWTTGRHVV